MQTTTEREAKGFGMKKDAKALPAMPYGSLSSCLLPPKRVTSELFQWDPLQNSPSLSISYIYDESTMEEERISNVYRQI